MLKRDIIRESIGVEIRVLDLPISNMREEKWAAKNDTMKKSCNHKFVSGHEYDHTF